MASSENSSSDDYYSASQGGSATDLSSTLHRLFEVNRKECEVQFSKDEEALIIRMYNLVGDRWSLIAGRIPGRTAEEIRKYWQSRYSTTGFER